MQANSNTPTDARKLAEEALRAVKCPCGAYSQYQLSCQDAIDVEKLARAVIDQADKLDEAVKLIERWQADDDHYDAAGLIDALLAKLKG